MTYSEVAKKIRLPLGFLLGAAYLVLAPGITTPLTLIVGGAIAAVGVLIRAWASGHITKNERLTVSGPYAHTRNPLYFGSFMIGAGFAVAAHWGLLLVVIAFWALVYAPTMQRERANISGRFPEAYNQYAANVPAFVPRVTRWKGSPDDQDRFSFALYMKHGEWKAALTYVLAIGWLLFRMRESL